jgi:hypothetical protein
MKCARRTVAEFSVSKGTPTHAYDLKAKNSVRMVSTTSAWARRSSAPGGNIGKPLMIALGALLASGVLFGRSGAGQSASTGSQSTSNEGAGGLLGGLGGLGRRRQLSVAWITAGTP